MIALLSPSKTLNDKNVAEVNTYSLPEFLDDSNQLVEILKEYSPKKLSKLMNINSKLSNLNVERYMQWTDKFTPENASPALLTFQGEVYNGLKAEELDANALEYAQDHVRILSGLYGILRPLDLIKPYRLEMGTSLKNSRGKDLYDFWGDRLTITLKKELEQHKEKVLVNLASYEYFKAIDKERLGVRVLNCQFKEERDGTFKFITIYGKKARGLMTRFIIDNKIDKPEDLKAFDLDNYYYNSELSGEDNYVFTR